MFDTFVLVESLFLATERPAALGQAKPSASGPKSRAKKPLKIQKAHACPKCYKLQTKPRQHFLNVHKCTEEECNALLSEQIRNENLLVRRLYVSNEQISDIFDNYANNVDLLNTAREFANSLKHELIDPPFEVAQQQPPAKITADVGTQCGTSVSQQLADVLDIEIDEQQLERLAAASPLSPTHSHLQIQHPQATVAPTSPSHSHLQIQHPQAVKVKVPYFDPTEGHNLGRKKDQIRKRGLYRRLTTVHSRSLKDFDKYLKSEQENVKDAARKRIISRVGQILYRMCRQTNFYSRKGIDGIFIADNQDSLKAFLKEYKQANVRGAAAFMNYTKAFIRFIRFLLFFQKTLPEPVIRRLKHLQHTIEAYNKDAHQLARRVRAEKLQTARRVTYEDVKAVLFDQNSAKRSERIMAVKGDPFPDYDTYYFFQSYLVTYVTFFSGQRSEIAQNMTVAEYQSGEYRLTESNDRVFVIAVYDHKNKSEGAHDVIIPAEIEKQMEFYLRMGRAKFANPKCDKFFITTRGSTIRTDVQCRRFQRRYLRMPVAQIIKPHEARSAMTTASDNYFVKDHGKKQLLAAVQDHTRDTATRYYVKHRRPMILVGYEVIKELIKLSSGPQQSVPLQQTLSQPVSQPIPSQQLPDHTPAASGVDIQLPTTQAPASSVSTETADSSSSAERSLSDSEKVAICHQAMITDPKTLQDFYKGRKVGQNYTDGFKIIFFAEFPPDIAASALSASKISHHVPMSLSHQDRATAIRSLRSMWKTEQRLRREKFIASVITSEQDVSKLSDSKLTKRLRQKMLELNITGCRIDTIIKLCKSTTVSSSHSHLQIQRAESSEPLSHSHLQIQQPQSVAPSSHSHLQIQGKRAASPLVLSVVAEPQVKRPAPSKPDVAPAKRVKLQQFIYTDEQLLKFSRTQAWEHVAVKDTGNIINEMTGAY